MQKTCLIDSKFYVRTDDSYGNFLARDNIYLARNGNGYVTIEQQENSSVCPQVSFVTYYYDNSFIADATGLFDAEYYPFILGSKVRLKTGGVWASEQLSPQVYDQNINLTLTGETLVTLESTLQYRGIVFDDTQPLTVNGGFEYWWDTSTETLYFVASGTPIEIDLSDTFNRTQEEILADSDPIQYSTASGAIIRRYQPHNIEKVDEIDSTEIPAALLNYRWALTNTQNIYGAAPKQSRKLSTEPDFSLNRLELCTKHQFKNPQVYQRYEYTQLDTATCQSDPGIAPCYQRDTYTCQEII